MASSWIIRRQTKSGTRYRVLFRVGGRESAHRYAGTFPTRAQALERRRWVDGELAAMRVPDVRRLEAPAILTLRALAGRWLKTRHDVADGTMQTYRVNLGRLLPRLGDRPVDAIDPQIVAELVAELHAAGLKKQSIRKTLSTFAQVLDYGRVTPNPARDKLT